MRSDPVVVIGIDFQNSAQMCLAQDNDVIQTLAPDRSDQPFGKAIVKSSQLQAYRLIGHKPSWLRMSFIPSTGELRLIDQYLAWGEDRVCFGDDGGGLRYLPTAWTSLAPPDPFVRASAGRSHFRVEDLLRLAALIAEQTPAQRPRPRRRRGRPV
jgi:hypothetical protein